MTVRDRFDGKHAAIGVGDLRARLLLVILCLIWGISWPVMKIALEDIPPLSMRTMSAGFGAVTLLVVCLVTRRPLRIPNAKVFGHVFIISLLNIVGFSLFSAFAQMAAATSRVAILAYTMPIWTVLLAWIVLRERPNSNQAVAVVLCALGLAVLVYPLAATGVPLGLVLAVASGLSWGAGTVYVKWAPLPLDFMAMAFWQVAIAFFVTAAGLLAFDGRLISTTPASDRCLLQRSSALPAAVSRMPCGLRSCGDCPQQRRHSEFSGSRWSAFCPPSLFLANGQRPPTWSGSP